MWVQIRRADGQIANTRTKFSSTQAGSRRWSKKLRLGKRPREIALDCGRKVADKVAVGS